MASGLDAGNVGKRISALFQSKNPGNAEMASSEHQLAEKTVRSFCEAESVLMPSPLCLLFCSFEPLFWP